MNKTIQVPLSEEDINTLKAGDYLYLSGIIYTATDSAHKRIFTYRTKWQCFILPWAKSGKRGTGYWFCRAYYKQSYG